MDYYKIFDGIAARIKYVYFVRDAASVFIWIKNVGSHIVPKELDQELREYEDSDLSGESLSINIIGTNNMTIRVGSDNHLMVWEVKACS